MLQAWFLCLLLLGLALRGATCPAHQHPMETRSECPPHQMSASLPHPSAPEPPPNLGHVLTKCPALGGWPVFSSPQPRVALPPASQAPCPAHVPGFASHRQAGRLPSAWSLLTQNGGGEAGTSPWSWCEFEFLFPKATPHHPEKVSPDPPGAPPLWVGPSLACELRAPWGAAPNTARQGTEPTGEHRLRLTRLFPPAPDIDPAWYTGRRIRPVGRFGRRRVALRNAPELSLWHQRSASPWKEALSPPRMGDNPAQEE